MMGLMLPTTCELEIRGECASQETVRYFFCTPQHFL
jgi:hypothetical protein